MNGHDLLVKLIEQNTEVTNSKIDTLATKIDTIEDKNTKAQIEHKVHDSMVENIQNVITDHMKNDFEVQKEISDKLYSIDLTLAINTKSLQEHMDNNIILRKLTEDNKSPYLSFTSSSLKPVPKLISTYGSSAEYFVKDRVATV